MNFPARGVEIIHALYHANPQDDAARRIDIQKVGSQMCFELGPNWGNKKRAGLSDDFRSPDTIAYREADGTVSVWDIQASSGQILVGADQPPTHANLSPGEATFMPCPPVNHLGATEPAPTPGTPPPSVPAPVDIGPVLAALADLKAIIEQVRDKPDPVVTMPTQTVTFPVYRGNLSIRYLGNAAIELKPEGQ